jgi:hypothetical protein
VYINPLGLLLLRESYTAFFLVDGFSSFLSARKKAQPNSHLKRQSQLAKSFSLREENSKQHSTSLQFVDGEALTVCGEWEGTGWTRP